ncbi:MAG: SMC-Scp complex subunit ScpB [Gammaproteobacteria bacterium]|nr:MAG: SMC-Scp complex subunit ScpB [Gammaproteobacteria bacterium]
MDNDQLKNIVEGALLASGRSLDIGHLQGLFDIDQVPAKDQLLAVLEDIENDCANRGYELTKTASGYRFQVRQELAPWINRLWEEKPKKYSRALLETLALIAYRQPLTRGDIEEIRGVSVSSEIVKTLLEREWVRVVGHRDVPGRPALYATTREFLDYFNLKSLEDLPALNDIRDIDSLDPELSLQVADTRESLVEGATQDQLPAEHEESAIEQETPMVDEESGMQQN